ncbi:unnamed protein product [Mytilus coruscus]|uniref:Uncharacterized protein n=1 Tax=Mytilus coruscus TaxID=42192 RepID=A0A6J8EY59_MYTCO|nr:unnamed protein product [Mytilus coruscus]
MAEDLKRFIFEEKDNLRRYRSNIDAIIRKYDRHFPDDAEIDLTTLTSSSFRDESVVKKLRSKPFGHSKLFTTKKKELSESGANGSCTTRDESVYSMITDGDSSLQETTINNWSPSDRYFSDVEETFTKETISQSYKPEPVNEEDSEFLALKTSYYEIISEQNDEPSDAETLSSYSSDSAGDMEDGSEDGDDEDSQTDDKGPHPIDIMDQDTSSMSSTEDNVNVLNKNCVQRSGPNKDRNPIYDEIDGFFSCKNKDKSGYTKPARPKEMSLQNNEINKSKNCITLETSKSINTDKSNIEPKRSTTQGYSNTGVMFKPNFNYRTPEDMTTSTMEYQQNQRIEKWLQDINTGQNQVRSDINIVTGQNQVKSDINFTRGQGFQNPNQTYVISENNKGLYNFHSEHNNTHKLNVNHKTSTYVQDHSTNTMLHKKNSQTIKNKSTDLQMNSRNNNIGKSIERIVPLTLDSSKQEKVSRKKEDMKMMNKQRFSPNNTKTEDRDSLLELNKLQPTNSQVSGLEMMFSRVPVITSFASPDRLYKKMKENKVGIAAKIIMTESTIQTEDKTKKNLQPVKSYTHQTKKPTTVLSPTQRKMKDWEKVDFFLENDDINTKKSTIVESSRFSKERSNIAFSTPAIKFNEEKVHKKSTNVKEFNLKPTSYVVSHCIKEYGMKPAMTNWNFNQNNSSDMPSKFSSKLHKHNIIQESMLKEGVNGKDIQDVNAVRQGERCYHDQKNPANFQIPAGFQMAASEKWVSPVKIKTLNKRARRKFVPKEDTTKLIELLFHPEEDVATFLSPKSFHRKFDKPVEPKVKPVQETLTYLSTCSKNQSKETSHKQLPQPGLRHWDWSKTIDQSIVSYQTETVIRNKNENSQLNRNASPFRSAKDLSSIESYVNTSFCSPDLHKHQQFQDTSKSVPAKLLQNSRSSQQSGLLMSPLEQRLQAISRTKMKAKRSLHMIENGKQQVSMETNEQQMKRYQNNEIRLPFSEDQHTPSKKHPYSFNSNEQSPSTIFSRMLLSTPSPGDRKRFSKFKTSGQQSTQTDDLFNVTTTKNETFKKPSSDFRTKTFPVIKSMLNRPSKTNLTSRYVSGEYSKKPFEPTSNFFRSEEFKTTQQNKQSLNTHFTKPTRTDLAQDHRRSDQERYVIHELCRDSNGNRRRELFQSTPVKSRNSNVFHLDNTMSTIHDTISDDDSDCEVMTISTSP